MTMPNKPSGDVELEIRSILKDLHASWVVHPSNYPFAFEDAEAAIQTLFATEIEKAELRARIDELEQNISRAAEARTYIKSIQLSEQRIKILRSKLQSKQGGDE